MPIWQCKDQKNYHSLSQKRHVAPTHIYCYHVTCYTKVSTKHIIDEGIGAGCDLNTSAEK